MRSLRNLFGQTSDSMACRQAVALLADYLDQALAPDERVRLEAHLAQCEPCSEYLAQIRAGITLAGRGEPEALDPSTRSALTNLYRTWQGEPRDG